MEPRLLVGEYDGFVGLNTANENLCSQVMQPDELLNFFKDHVPLEALYAYPRTVACAFGRPPTFSVSNVQPGYGFTLNASVFSNREPHGCSQTSASLFLPREYTAQYQLTFDANEEEGFGNGTCRINSLRVNKPNGRNAMVARCLLGVKNRPALFLKVANLEGGINPDVMIYFPDKPNEISHRSVRFGEAFVLVKQGTLLTRELKQAIAANFATLVQSSYGSDNGLYDTADHELLDTRLYRNEFYLGNNDW